jgi:hypothetical protein
VTHLTDGYFMTPTYFEQLPLILILQLRSLKVNRFDIISENIDQLFQTLFNTFALPDQYRWLSEDSNLDWLFLFCLPWRHSEARFDTDSYVMIMCPVDSDLIANVKCYLIYTITLSHWTLVPEYWTLRQPMVAFRLHACPKCRTKRYLRVTFYV